MNRKEFLQRTVGCCALFACPAPLTGATPMPRDERSEQFVQNWLTDLLDTIESTLDRETAVRLIEGCGRGCYRRHQFKQDIAARGKGDPDRLIEAYKQNFEIWREGENLVHIRYGAVSRGCYCPAAIFRPSKPNDLHCECTRATHETIWQEALGHPVRIEILETVRRGNPTCHFLVHLEKA